MRLIPIGEGYWNVRASFKVFMVLNIGMFCAQEVFEYAASSTHY